MYKIMKAKSIKGKSLQEIQTVLQESMEDGFKPTLAVVFLSVKQDRNAICNLLSEKDIVVFGATTSGEFIDGQFSNGGTAVLLLEISSELFSLLYEPEAEKDTRIKARNLAEKAMEQFKNPAFVVAGSGLRVDGELVIRGIEDAAGIDTTIYGGLAGDDLKMQEAFVFTNGKFSKQGIIMLAFDGDKIEFKGRATHGVQGVGTLKTITKAEGWWIHTIDDQPALDLVAKYMGIKIEKKGKISPIPPEYTSTYPMVLHGKKGDAIIRPVLMFNYENGSVMSNGMVEQGAKVQLSLPPDFEIIDEVVNDCKEVKNNELREADALIMFSCAGRLSSLGPLISDEIDGVKNTFKVPLAGFFSYGEFGRATNGNHEYHNLTCCSVALKEK
jgi:hypothetical protein